MNEQLNATLMSWVQFFNDPLWDFLVIFLLAVGIFYTVLTGAVQIRMFLQSIRVMKSSRTEGEDEHGLTPFQAFVTGLASRVGVGNIAGVAIATRNWWPWRCVLDVGNCCTWYELCFY